MRPVVGAALERWRQRGPSDLEAGGLLLGKLFPDEAMVELVGITSPLPGDDATRTRFVRRSPLHEALANVLRHATDARVGYVGAWHTHPEAVPTPSSLDLTDWRRALRLDTFGIPVPVFIIVGTEEICAWSRGRWGRRFRRIEIER